MKYARVPGAELYPSLSGTGLSRHSVAARARGGPQDGSDSLAALAGYAATKPSPSQSSIKADAFLVNQQQEEEDERRTGPSPPHSSPFMPFIIHPKQILFKQALQEFWRRVRWKKDGSFG